MQGRFIFFHSRLEEMKIFSSISLYIPCKIIILIKGSSSFIDTSYSQLFSIDMVILQLSSSNPVNPQAKHSILELARSRRKHLSTFSSFSLPSLFISNSQQPQNPISSFPQVNQVCFSFVCCLSFYCTFCQDFANAYMWIIFENSSMAECCSYCIWRWIRVKALSIDKKKIRRRHSHRSKLQNRWCSY
jgi:hypothetical protein